MPFDFSAVIAPFRMQPGLRRLAEGAAQLTANHIGDRALREKLAVLGSHSSQALLCTPGFDAEPMLRTLCRHAVAEHPGAVSWDGDHALCATHLGWSLRGHEFHGDGPPEISACLSKLSMPWRLPALLCLAFAEDFAVIDGVTGHIPWLAVCLPSHWAPEEKVGRHFAEVHAPVSDNQVLITASDHLARLVTGQDRWERFVWNITTEPRLHMHPHHGDRAPWLRDAGADALAAQAFFRTERQTFIPLPAQRQAIFTIHVEVQPMVLAMADAGHARQLHDALASMSAAVLGYRGLTTARDRLLAWLHGRSAPSGPIAP